MHKGVMLGNNKSTCVAEVFVLGHPSKHKHIGTPIFIASGILLNKLTILTGLGCCVRLISRVWSGSRVHYVEQNEISEN